MPAGHLEHLRRVASRIVSPASVTRASHDRISLIYPLKDPS